MHLLKISPVSASPSITLFTSQADLLQEVCPPPTEAEILQRRLIKGMIQAGRGREVIAAVLGLTDDALMQRVVAFGLPTPADIPFLEPRGPRCWTVPHMHRLVQLWTLNVTGSAIGAELGRSASGVYSKARGLGLYRRERVQLVRAIHAVAESIRVVAEAIFGKAARSKRKEIVWTEDLEDQLADRWFSMQHHAAIAGVLGVSPTTIASKAYRLELPRRCAQLLTEDYDPARKQKGLAMYPGIMRKHCKFTRKAFWGYRSGPATSAYAKRELAGYAAATAVSG
jgi:hypothetical protein